MVVHSEFDSHSSHMKTYVKIMTTGAWKYLRKTTIFKSIIREESLFGMPLIIHDDAELLFEKISSYEKNP